MGFIDEKYFDDQADDIKISRWRADSGRLVGSCEALHLGGAAVGAGDRGGQREHVRGCAALRRRHRRQHHGMGGARHTRTHTHAHTHTHTHAHTPTHTHTLTLTLSLSLSVDVIADSIMVWWAVMRGTHTLMDSLSHARMHTNGISRPLAAARGWTSKRIECVQCLILLCGEPCQVNRGKCAVNKRHRA